MKKMGVINLFLLSLLCIVSNLRFSSADEYGNKIDAVDQCVTARVVRGNNLYYCKNNLSGANGTPKEDASEICVGAVEKSGNGGPCVAYYCRNKAEQEKKSEEILDRQFGQQANAFARVGDNKVKNTRSVPLKDCTLPKASGK